MELKKNNKKTQLIEDKLNNSIGSEFIDDDEKSVSDKIKYRHNKYFNYYHTPFDTMKNHTHRNHTITNEKFGNFDSLSNRNSNTQSNLISMSYFNYRFNWYIF